MLTFWLVFLLLINFGISWLNAVYAGKVWTERFIMGPWFRLVAWSTAIMSALGFTSVIVVVLTGIGYFVAPAYVTLQVVQAIMSLTYALIIFPLLGTGLVITIETWIRAYRERDFVSVGVAAYNTFAQIHNMVDAFSTLPSAIGNLADFFSSSDDDDGIVGVIARFIVLAIVTVGLFGGIVLTRWIMRRSMGTLPVLMPQQQAQTA